MTKRYTIEKRATAYRVSEADGPNAPASGEYDTLQAAQDAVLAVSGRTDLDWEYGCDEGIEWWAAEWEDA